MNKEPSMLNDLLATDAKNPLEEAFQIIEEMPKKEITLPDGSPPSDSCIPVDLRKLGHEMFAIIIGALMDRTNETDITITDTAIACLTPECGRETLVLACTCNPQNGDFRLQLLTAPKSEFRS